MRGIIEGFYGPPWTRAARLEMLEFVAARSMNAYVYAPKSDPMHRDRWREPYDTGSLNHFAELAEYGRKHDVRFGFAISPGLDIDYRAPDDRRAVMLKLASLLDAGIDWMVLALDDIPSRAGLARDQVDLARWLLDALRQSDAAMRLSLVPTEYVGTVATPYLRELGAGLPEDVDVMWTGPTVCSPIIRAVDAESWGAALGRRAPIVWDNYPVNDGSMEHALHLGPYRGREPELSDVVEGVLCNPMLQARASQLALATAADYLLDPAGYDPETSWDRAVREVGSSRAVAIRAIGTACADSPLLPAEQLEAARLTRSLADAASEAEWGRARAALHVHLTAVRRAARTLGEGGNDDAFAAELAPWLDQARAEADAGLAALRLLEHLGPPRPAPAGERAPERVIDDAEPAMHHAFATLFAWGRARSRSDRVVFGPRFAVYPAVVQLGDGRPGLDVDLALVENANAIDALCRLALERYRGWTATQRDTTLGAGTD